MRISLDTGPRNIARIRKTHEHITIRVISGDCIIGRDRQGLSDGGGMPVYTSDGIVSIAWEVGELWMAGAPTAVVEVIVP